MQGSTRRTLVRRPAASSSAAVPVSESSSADTISAEETGVEYGPPVPSTLELLKVLADRQEELDAARSQLAMSRFGLQRYSTDSDKLYFYTGFKNYSVLTSFIDFLSPAAQQMAYPYCKRVTATSLSSRRVLPLGDELFLTLCRLRAGLLEEDIADRFNLSVATVSRIFLAWINLMYVVLGSVPIWPSKKCVSEHMPPRMKQLFPSVRVIIDCTEIFTQKPSSLLTNSQLFSNYKSHTTFKALIGIAPHGPITFVSNLYTGSISDVELTKVCGLLELLEPGDCVMADKGFTIQKILDERGVGLAIPHFLTARGKFTSREIAENDAITTYRVHVERAIRRVKENRIFQGIIPLSMIGSINQIWTVCCLLANFRPPLM